MQLGRGNISREQRQPTLDEGSMGESSDCFTISVQGRFDISTMDRVRRELAQVEPRSFVQVDMTEARDVEDSAVALLAGLMLVRRGRIQVKGLRQHQLRLLGYLGVTVDGWRDGKIGDQSAGGFTDRD
jgi:ABC-type transporter Mla MlaB component